ncbi:hypothetical protein PC116_g19218 [Phytophthora cactorum]|uniref:Uncharacterized protein n=1 Tax=Phytophthora cactorum TaxID=29920 RepID=A0A8T1CJV7_9STRA|nr:hypothetical protein PC112_g14929 [Phytophthora cactorum]KAG2852344.1 hypothetical protein PC113_g15114 [Phytophthora cactorum]KAG2893533.1 hypothetical protein PC114_g16210 [Phytophthora cactorum]KAG2923452.1 hypothetical protein PC117_g15740 [Phytophthora cactorum]KAG3003191.1 hypothetical protein PC119_g16102 [Phytophthora cactorum]
MQQPAVKLALQKLRKEWSAVLNVAVAETDIDGPPYCFAESAGDGVDTGGGVVDTDDAEDTSTAEQPTKPTNISATCAKTSVEWPKDVHRLYKPLNSDRITFRDLGSASATLTVTLTNACTQKLISSAPSTTAPTADKALAFTLSSQSKLAKLLNTRYSLLLNQWASDGRFVYSEP